MQVSGRAEHEGYKIGVFCAEDGVGSEGSGGESGCGGGEDKCFC